MTAAELLAQKGGGMRLQPSAQTRIDPLAPSPEAAGAAFEESAPYWLGQRLARLPTAMVEASRQALEMATSLPGRIAPQAPRAQEPARLRAEAQELLDYPQSEPMPDLAPGQITNVPGLQPPTATAPTMTAAELLAQKAAEKQRQAARVEEDVDTSGASLLRDVALTGLTASGAGTPVGAAATVGIPGVLEAFELNEPFQKLGKRTEQTLSAGEPGPLREAAAGIAGEAVAQAPMLGGLAFGMRRAPQPAPVGGAPQQAAQVNVFGRATEKAIRRGTGQQPSPRPAEATPAPAAAPKRQPVNLLTLLEKITPEPVARKLRSNVENIAKVSPEAAEATKQRSELQNLLTNEVSSLQSRIRETLSEAESSRITQLMEGLPKTQLGKKPTERLDPVKNPDEYARRVEEYRQRARVDVEANSPGLRTEVKDLAAESMALSRVAEDIGGLGPKELFSYKMTAKERAPLNVEEARLRKEILTPEEELGLEGRRLGLKQELETTVPIKQRQAFEKELADVNATLRQNPENVKAYEEVTAKLKRDFTGKKGYAKQLFQEKLAENLLKSQEATRPTGRSQKTDLRGFTQRQDAEMTSGLTRIRTAPELLARAVMDNANKAKSEIYFDAIKATPMAQKAADAKMADSLQKQGWQKLGDDEAWGALKDHYVHPSVWKELEPAANTVKNPGTFAKALGELTDFRARNLTVGTPASNVMNTLGGLFAGDVMTPVSILEAPLTLWDGFHAAKSPYAVQVRMRGGTTMAKEAKLLEFMEKEFQKKVFTREGDKVVRVPEGTEGAFSLKEKLNEAQKSKRTMVGRTLDAVDTGMEAFQAYAKYLGLEPVAAAANPVAMARFHNVMEGIIRDGLYVRMRKKGLSHREASDLVAKSQVDYTQPSDFVTWLRGFGLGGFGQRFAQFGIQQGKNLLEASTSLSPEGLRFWKWPLMSALWNSEMQKLNKESEDDKKQRLSLRKPFEAGTGKDTPIGFASGAFMPDFMMLDLPRDGEGKIQTLNARRMNPFGWLQDIGGGIKTAVTSEADRPAGIKQAVAALFQPHMGVAPVLDVLNDYSPFFQRSVLPGGTTAFTPEGARAAGEYLGQAYLPQAAGEFPANRARVGRMEENPLAMGLRGQRVMPEEDLLRLLSGLRLRRFDPNMERGAVARRMKRLGTEASPAFLMQEDVTQRGAQELQKENLRKLRELGLRIGGQ